MPCDKILLATDWLRRLKMKIKHAIFDLDGTLLDSNGVWIDAVFKYIDDYCSFKREDLPKIFESEIILGGSSEALEYLRSTMGDSRSIAETREIIMSAVAKGYEFEREKKKGALEFLARLKSLGADICVITATPSKLSHKAIEKAGLCEYIDFLISCNDRKSGKNEPYIFLEAAARMNCDITECTLFEDALYSMQTGKNLGMTVIGIDDYYCKNETREEIRKTCDLYVTDYSQIFLES